MMERIKRIKKAIFGKGYRLSFVLFFIGFYVLNFLLNKTHVFYSTIETVILWYAISFVVINFLIALMVAVTFNLVRLKLNETRSLEGKQGGFATIGFTGGILAGGCPACFTGVLPALIGFTGIGVSYNNTPYVGLGIQVVSLFILIFSIYLLSANPVCKIKFKS